MNPSEYAIYRHRRDALIEILRDENPEVVEGALIVFAGFEQDDRNLFRQESSFYYLTGVKEPGSVLVSYFDGSDVLYLPVYSGKREQWVTSALKHDETSAGIIQVDEIKHLGLPQRGYSLNSFVGQNTYFNLLNDLSQFLHNPEAQVFTFKDKTTPRYIYQMHAFDYLSSQLPALSKATHDCSYIVHELRKCKDDYEIDCMHKAAQITSLAHNAAAATILPGKTEREVQAMVESIFTVTGASRPAFPSIIASGKNSTILHYTDRNKELKEGDLVVVDIGSEFNYYASDITRTYPVSGKFTSRQKEIYDIVLNTQSYIESIAAPGMYLNNPEKSDKSLHHLAIEYLKKAGGYDKYFVHNIGHFLGLDVHDVGDISLPLEEGHVITIEPGIYIPEESIGIRIEDDYVIIDGGCLPLSGQLSKTTEEIESLMAER
ncbi:aminopeptidase P family protein [Candidatus Babeliales bacterium]|nr:aminopeptidase P family protein [Candidatus Babeliales bacterium]